MRDWASMLSSGALVIHPADARRRGQYAAHLGESAERAHRTPSWLSTLLGPEGAAVPAVAFLNGLGSDGADALCGLLFRPYLENCIVNAKHLYICSA